MNIALYIDHTILKPTTLVAEVKQLCEEAVSEGFAAVCVPPLFVKMAKLYCMPTAVKVATVIGFPFGYSAIEAKVAEILLAIVDGVDELDVVINIAALKNGDWQYLSKELNAIMLVVRKNHKVIKIIIETGVLTDAEIIQCCDLYGIAGVDYVKTSTGYAQVGASLQTVMLLRKHLADTIKIKASGGIQTLAMASAMIVAGADRLGTSSGLKIMQEQKTLNDANS